MLGLTPTSSAIDAGIQKKIYSGSGTTTSVTSNDEMNDIMKIVQALENSGILMKGVTKTIKNETKSQSGGYLSILLGTLASFLLGNLSTDKGNLLTAKGTTRLNGVYSRDNLPKTIKNGAYVINLDE